jgi:hypothetical protein
MGKGVNTVKLQSAVFLCLFLSFGIYAEPIAEREQARQMVAAGQLRGGCEALVQNMRNWPDDAAQVDRVEGTIHLLLFSLEYLMDEPSRIKFRDEVLRPEENEMDDLILSGLYLNLDSGLSQEEFQSVARKLVALSTSSRPPVKVLALALLGAPYYFRDSQLGANARQELLANYPDLEISKTVLRAVAYTQREALSTSPSVALAALQAGKLSKRGAEDPVVVAVRRAAEAQGGQADCAKGAAALVEAVRASEDPYVRYSCLRMLEAFTDTRAKGLLVAAYQELKDKPGTPESFNARVSLLRIARKDRDAGATKTHAQALLSLENMPVLYDRNPYEDLKNEVVQAADDLATLGDSAGAKACLDGLAAKFPGSALAAECRTKVDALAKH